MVNVTSRVELGEPREPTNATVIFKDPRAFIGYVFYHMRYPVGFPSKSNDDPCDDRWEVSAPDKSGEAMLANLVPFTRYVYYVRTMAISSELTNAESAVEEFKTNPGQPSKVTEVVVTAISDSKIVSMALSERIDFRENSISKRFDDLFVNAELIQLSFFHRT